VLRVNKTNLKMAVIAILAVAAYSFAARKFGLPSLA
jgi:hypothetical protein